eukprot:1363024-Rhodomonas_salina.2
MIDCQPGLGACGPGPQVLRVPARGGRLGLGLRLGLCCQRSELQTSESRVEFPACVEPGRLGPDSEAPGIRVTIMIMMRQTSGFKPLGLGHLRRSLVCLLRFSASLSRVDSASFQLLHTALSEPASGRRRGRSTMTPIP